MNDTAMLNALQSAFRLNEPLSVGDRRYVAVDSVRLPPGLPRVAQQLCNLIERAGQPAKVLLTGQRGCGKTTELLQLPVLLRDYFVVRFEAHQYFEREEIDLSQVLLGIATSIAEGLKNAGIQVDESKSTLLRLLREIGATLATPLNLKEAKVNYGIVEFSFEAANAASFRDLIRQPLKSRLNQLHEAVCAYIDQAVRAVQASGKLHLVVIADNLDRLQRISLPGSEMTSHTVIFLEGAPKLNSLPCHIVFTFPPELRYEMAGAQLPSLYESQPIVLPMIPVIRRDGSAHEEGLAAMVEIVTRRVPPELGEAFESPDLITRLAAESGGFIRGLLASIQACASHAERLPLTSQDVDQAMAQQAMMFEDALQSHHFNALARIDRTHKRDESEEVLDLLKTYALLEYRDAAGAYMGLRPVCQRILQARLN